MDPLASEYNVHEAKTHFSRLLERVERGEEIVINRSGHPVAKVIPLPSRANRVSFGTFAESLTLDDDWDSPESNAQLAADWDS